MANTQKDIEPVRLKLELISDYLSSEEKVMLKRYGESSSGDRITREVLIPSDMTLHALHYAMQKLFGWQNSHLRQFNLPKDVYQELTQGTVKGCDYCHTFVPLMPTFLPLFAKECTTFRQLDVPLKKYPITTVI